MALSASGLGSGLDINSLVSQLMAVERQPLTAMAEKGSELPGQAVGLRADQGQPLRAADRGQRAEGRGKIFRHQGDRG